jgi:hypothetical protein
MLIKGSAGDIHAIPAPSRLNDVPDEKLIGAGSRKTLSGTLDCIWN